MRGWKRHEVQGRRHPRLAAASLDYVLLLGVILPAVGIVFYYGPKIIKSVYEMTCFLIAWPFM